MTELLALPGWNVTQTPLSAWVEQLEKQGLRVTLTRESTGVSWIEVAELRVRGYAVTEGRRVEAINFELTAADPGPARLALEEAAAALAWELDEDEDEDADEDED